ncbi:MAG: sulfatase-like hydrolase/transferase [Candidatus Lokiarchaeota archaeon]|nr:sulfatase-like hydrolase/transferase [Candidatus Lokiarchaeota archaeon]
MKRERDKKAVILITIDALRADHLGPYGYQLRTAPNLEKFVEKGTIFMNAVANGPESPTSFSSIFTSILPLLDGGFSPLPREKITIAQILNEYGIFTYGIHCNPNLGSFFNYDRGFNIFIDGERFRTVSKIKENKNLKQITFSLISTIIFNIKFFNKLMYRLKGFNKVKGWLRKIPLITDIILPFIPIAYNAPYVTNRVISVLAKKKKPIFLWAHYMDVHNPYNPPTRNILNFTKKDISLNRKEYLNENLLKKKKKIKITPAILDDLKLLYNGEINYVDEYLGKLLEFIQVRFQNNCLIIITSDHGESFYEHGFFGHQANLFEELLHVPLFIVELGKNIELHKIQENVQLLDIAPTILNYFGIPIPDNFQGESLLPLVDENSSYRERFIISECYQKNGIMKRNKDEGFIMISIRSDEWKYIHDEENNQEFLFNLKSDPKEQSNLINKELIKANKFREIRDEHVNKISLVDEKSKILRNIETLDLKKSLK